MSATASDLTDRCTEFATTPTATINLALADALNQINVTNWGDTKAFYGQIYLAAHLLRSWTDQSSGSASGPVTMHKDGDLQVSYAASAAAQSDQDLASTKWGNMYLDLRSQVFSVRNL